MYCIIEWKAVLLLIENYRQNYIWHFIAVTDFDKWKSAEKERSESNHPQLVPCQQLERIFDEIKIWGTDQPQCHRFHFFKLLLDPFHMIIF